jgi:hypothetical protein
MGSSPHPCLKWGAYSRSPGIDCNRAGCCQGKVYEAAISAVGLLCQGHVVDPNAWKKHARIDRKSGQLLPRVVRFGCCELNFKKEINEPGLGDSWKTHDPHMNDARFAPRYRIIQIERFIFSPPLSPRTREGHPYLLIASKNSWRTVDDSLLVLAFIAVTFTVDS